MTRFRLQDVCTKIGSGATPRGGKHVYLDNGVVALIRSQNVYNEGFNRNGLVFIDSEHSDQLNGVEVWDKDVLLNITGHSVARVCQVPTDVLPARVNQHVAIIRPDPDFLDPRFLRFFLASSQMQAKMLGLAASGATRNALTKKMIESLEVPALPLDVQQEIGRLLGALEDKIELNRRMNETLETMARTIFKDWFVDFGPTRAKAAGHERYLAQDIWDLFPDGFDDEDRPVGWRRERLDDLFTVSIGRTPPRKEWEHFVPGGQGRTWLSIRAMGSIQTFAMASEEDLTAAAVERFQVPLIPEGSVLVSFKLTVGRVAIAEHDMHSNEAIAQLAVRDDGPLSNLFAYCFMKEFDYDSLGSTSSIAKAVNSKSIKEIRMIVPDSATHGAFVALVRPIFDLILSNVRESSTLLAIRDLLLPKLMSGEIRLTEAEKMAEDVS